MNGKMKLLHLEVAEPCVDAVSEFCRKDFRWLLACTTGHFDEVAVWTMGIWYN
jgi:hypothetical protein